MVNYMDCKFDDLLEDATKHKRTKELKMMGFEGGRPVSYLTLKRKYYVEYYPQLMPVAATPKKKFYEILEEL